MAYLHIKNLYKEQDILMFKECYALEKIHGTSAHIKIINEIIEEIGREAIKEPKVTFFSGGEKHERFIMLFNEEKLKEKFKELKLNNITIYGEAYGGKLLKMKKTYGDMLKFVAFEVKIGDKWLSVPQAEYFVKEFGLEFVAYEKIPTTLEAIDAERIKPSVQAKRNGIEEPKLREGIVLRSLQELTKNNGGRIIAKREITDPEKLKKIK